MSAYNCTAELATGAFEAKAQITDDAIELRGGGCATIPFVDLMDMRLLNYHLHLSLRNGEAVISKLGYQTEEFFEKLWQAYAKKSLESLFVTGDPVIACEGDYSYAEPGISRSSIAKLELRDDSLCIIPHDVGARRVPLCFAQAPIRDGFALAATLDTGETYRVARLGANTDPFFKHMTSLQKQAVSDWEAAHRALGQNLEARLGDSLGAYQAFCGLGVSVTTGLFSADDDAFWFAAIGNGRAAVELVCEEKAATYLYRFSTDAGQFAASLRHAMEAVKRHRRLIFLTDEELASEPLFRMAVDRSAHVRFLRSCNAGRIIHASNWASKLAEFFSPAP